MKLWRKCNVLGRAIWDGTEYQGEEIVQIYEDDAGNTHEIQSFSVEITGQNDANSSVEYTVYVYGKAGKRALRRVQFEDYGGPWRQDETLMDVRLELNNETRKLIWKMMDMGWVPVEKKVKRRKIRYTEIETICKLQYRPRCERRKPIHTPERPLHQFNQ